MKFFRSNQQRRNLMIMVSILVGLGILAGCEQPNQHAATVASGVVATQPQATNTVHMDIDATKQAGVNAIATHLSIVATHAAPTAAIWDMTDTAIAQTPMSLRATFTPYPTAPIATPQLGILSDTVGFGGSAYYVFNYWRGTVDSQLGGVGSALWGHGWSSGKDPSQGLVVVFKGLYWSSPGNDEIYNTPIKVGPMLITSVNGTIVTLVEAHIDPTTNIIAPFAGGAIVVFDLATRQFTSAQCGPNSNSCTPVPLGTTTPVSTPLPTTTP